MPSQLPARSQEHRAVRRQHAAKTLAALVYAPALLGVDNAENAPPTSVETQHQTVGRSRHVPMQNFAVVFSRAEAITLNRGRSTEQMWGKAPTQMHGDSFKRLRICNSVTRYLSLITITSPAMNATFVDRSLDVLGIGRRLTREEAIFGIRSYR